MEEYQKRIYFIPENFALEGKGIRGIAYANLIEAAILFAFFLTLDILLLPKLTYKIYGAVVCMVPAALAIVGVNGLSLSSFFADMIRYRAHNSVYAKPTPESILAREKQIIREKHRMLKAEKAAKKKEAKAQAKLEKRQAKQQERKDKQAGKKSSQLRQEKQTE